MDESKFFESAIPTPWTILGVRLLPFSLGHNLILHRLQSPFVTPDKQAHLGDLLLAIIVCSRQYHEALEAIDSEDLSHQVEAWGKMLRGRYRFLGWLRKPLEIDWNEKAVMFQQYIAENSKSPDYSFNPSMAKEINCPIVQLVKVGLLHQTNLTETEIMNRPWGLALWDYITLKCISGQVDLIDSKANQEAYDKAKALFERLNNGKLKPNGEIRN